MAIEPALMGPAVRRQAALELPPPSETERPELTVNFIHDEEIEAGAILTKLILDYLALVVAVHEPRFKSVCDQSGGRLGPERQIASEQGKVGVLIVMGHNVALAEGANELAAPEPVALVEHGGG